MSDADLLSVGLRSENVMDREIALPYPAVLRAIAVLEAQGVFLVGWEPLAVYSDGRMGTYPSSSIGGLSSVEIPPSDSWRAGVQASAELHRATIEEEWRTRCTTPIQEGVTLVFCLSVELAPASVVFASGLEPTARRVAVTILPRWWVAIEYGSSDYRVPVDSTDAELFHAHDRFVPSRADVVVELQINAGGISPMALLGGSFVRDRTDALDVRIISSQPQAEGSDDERPSLTTGGPKSLFLGLPDAHVPDVRRGFERRADLNSVGTLTVDQAAWHPVNSTPRAFEQASLLLRWALLRRTRPTELELAQFIVHHL